ncbi:MAG: hypothetical protein JWM98_1807 [Thermoleophilia bacterium]|nr:hypothetical protein [Thermoleophilia bacterium]
MTYAPRPLRPLPAVPTIARAPQNVVVPFAESCWCCGEKWHPALLTTSGAGPCCVLDHDDDGSLPPAA